MNQPDFSSLSQSSSQIFSIRLKNAENEGIYSQQSVHISISDLNIFHHEESTAHTPTLNADESHSQLLMPHSDSDYIQNNFIASSATDIFNLIIIDDMKHPQLSEQYFPSQSLHIIQYTDIIESAQTSAQSSMSLANPFSEQYTGQFLSLKPHTDIIDSVSTSTQSSTCFGNSLSDYSSEQYSEQFLFIESHMNIIDSASTSTQASVTNSNAPFRYHFNLYI